MFAPRRYFLDITLAGMAGAPFAELKRLGIAAEERMLRAAQGINTHRGAIFCLGLLCAAIGRCRAAGTPLTAEAIRSALMRHWGAALGTHGVDAGTQSHGARALLRYAPGGAREEGARGFPSVFELGLPALQRTLAAGRGMRRARIDALFALMAHISDTNVYHRGGSAAPDWEARALACHRSFVAARLSSGGAADLLGAVCLIHAACGGEG